MSLRARMGLASGVAVALAVFAVAISAYAGTRSELRSQVDNSLRGLAQPILDRARSGPGGPGQDGNPRPGQPSTTGPLGVTNTDCDLGLGVDRGPTFGAAAGVKGFIAPNGSACTVSGNSGSIPVDARARALARSQHGQYFTDATVDGHHLRALVTGIPGHGALVVALPLQNVDQALSSQLLLLILIAAAGIALAALLGILVARTALAPIARFTRRAEQIAANPERHNLRLEEEGGDELGRLAETFNATLDALERSVQSQRNLVADASHELRTPIATLRANLQLMRDESRLSAADRDALREDMISELDELTGLVGDVVELARGSKPTGAQGDVRVDAIAEDVAERTRRRAPDLTVQTTLEPTLVLGEADRIARAITNLLDNARKWSPSDGLIEVGLRDGVLTVRDHGPGFEAEDLPFVFDRFHRAREARSKPGSGLGLAIVRQAAEAHGGSAEAHNAPGGGALLRVSFGPSLEIDRGAELDAGQPSAPLRS
jgi:two-component system, OmpR family, sensor histidine kinase MprB